MLVVVQLFARSALSIVGGEEGLEECEDEVGCVAEEGGEGEGVDEWIALKKAVEVEREDEDGFDGFEDGEEEGHE
jgi:hypothetical protein